MKPQSFYLHFLNCNTERVERERERKKERERKRKKERERKRRHTARLCGQRQLSVRFLIAGTDVWPGWLGRV